MQRAWQTVPCSSLAHCVDGKQCVSHPVVPTGDRCANEGRANCEGQNALQESPKRTSVSPWVGKRSLSDKGLQRLRSQTKPGDVQRPASLHTASVVAAGSRGWYPLLHRYVHVSCFTPSDFVHSGVALPTVGGAGHVRRAQEKSARHSPVEARHLQSREETQAIRTRHGEGPTTDTSQRRIATPDGKQCTG